MMVVHYNFVAVENAYSKEACYNEGQYAGKNYCVAHKSCIGVNTMYCTKLSNKIELVVIKAIFIRGKMKIFGVDKMAKIYLKAKTVKNEKKLDF